MAFINAIDCCADNAPRPTFASAAADACAPAMAASAAVAPLANAAFSAASPISAALASEVGMFNLPANFRYDIMAPA